MPLVFLAVFFGLAFAEFKLIATVYRFITVRYDAASAVLLICLSFFFAVFLGARLIRFPNKDMSRKILFFLAGLLFIVPGYVSDVAALACLFPPTAWIMNFAAKRVFNKLTKSPNFAFYTNFTSPPNSMNYSSPSNRANDPTVIDVEVVNTPQKLL